MIDARSDRFNIGIYHNKPFRVIASLIILVAFFVSTFSYDLARAADGGSSSVSIVADSGKSGNPNPKKILNVKTFTIPEDIGHIREAWSAVSTPRRGLPSDNSLARGESPQKVVIQIQDAHCNYAAQKRIAEIIEYLNTEYGISAVNLEGGARDYDLSIFTDIADRNVRKKTADYFVKEGLVSGAEYFAINNPEKVSLWGVEDPALYMKNLNVYRDSLTHKDEIEKSLKSLGYILTNLKIKIYSKELLEFDKKYSQYKANNIEFKEYLDYIFAAAKEKAVDISAFRNISLLNKSLQEEAYINFSKANNERDSLIDMLHKKLSRNSMEELVVKTVEFKTGKIPQKDFYDYLLDKAKKTGLDLTSLSELQKYVAYIAAYDAIDKIKVMDELDGLETKIKDAMFENSAQKDLSALSKNLTLLKNMFDISLTRDDYRYYKANEDAFAIRHYTRFIEKEAPLVLNSSLRGREAAEAISKSDLDRYREEISKFYDCSFERDKAFLKNIRLADSVERIAYSKNLKINSNPDNTLNAKRYLLNANHAVILITGGFHTDNLCELFKKEGISYISIVPTFINDKGYQSPYFELLAGKEVGLVGQMRAVLLSASSMQVPSPFSKAIAEKVFDKIGIDALEAAVELERMAIEKGWEIDRIEPWGESIVVHLRDGTTKEILMSQLTIEPALSAPDKAREELLRRFEDFALSARKGDWVVKFDGPRIGATNDAYGPEATDWFVDEIIKKTVIDFAIQNKIPAKVGGRSSEEFTFCFPATLSENDIRIKIDALMQNFKDKSGRYTVITLNTKLNADQITELKSAGAAFVYSVGIEGQGKVRTKIIFNKKVEDKIRDLLKAKGQAVEGIEGLRVPYPVSAAARLAADNDFKEAYLTADRRQEQYKNTPIEDGGELLIFALPALKTEKEEALIELNVDSQDRRLIEDAVSKKAENLSSTLYAVEQIYGAYARSSLGILLADLREMPLSERSAGIYLIRAPPNEFYVINVKADGSFELVKFDTLFFASNPNMAEQFNKILVSGRAPFNAKDDAREMFGFKAINTIFGHDDGNFVIKAIRYSIDKAFDDNRNASLEDKARMAAGELNRLFNGSGFGCFIIASHITEKEAVDNKGYKDFIASAITRVDDLIRARDVLISEVTGRDSIVKRYSKYRYKDREIADNLELARYYKMITGENTVTEADRDLAAKAQDLHEAVGRMSSSAQIIKIINSWKNAGPNGTEIGYAVDPNTIQAVLDIVEKRSETIKGSPAILAKLCLIYEHSKPKDAEKNIEDWLNAYDKSYVFTAPKAGEIKRPPVNGLSWSAFFDFMNTKVRDPSSLSLIPFLEYAIKEGVSNVEIPFDFLPFGFAARLAEEIPDTEIEDIKNILEKYKEYGLTITIHSPLVGPLNSKTQYKQLFEDAADNISMMHKQIETAGRIGAKMMVVHMSSRENTDEYAGLVLYARINAPGLKIVFENYQNKKKVFPSAEDFMKTFAGIIERVAAQDKTALNNIGIVVDTAHYNLTGSEDPVVSSFIVAVRAKELAAKYGIEAKGLLAELHVNQNIGPIPFYGRGFSADIHANASLEGPINNPGIISMLALMGYDPLMTLEQMNLPDDRDIRLLDSAITLARGNSLAEVDIAGSAIMETKDYKAFLKTQVADPSMLDEAYKAYRILAGLIGRQAFEDHVKRRIYQKILTVKSEAELSSLKANLREIGLMEAELGGVNGKIVVTDEKTGKPMVVDFEVNPGNFVGEMAIITEDHERTATIVSRADTVALVLTAAVIKDIRRLMPNFADLMSTYKQMRDEQNEAKIRDAAVKAAVPSTGRFAKNYPPGTYRTIAVSYEGAITVADYDENGIVSITEEIVREGNSKTVIRKVPGPMIVVHSPDRVTMEYEEGVYDVTVSVFEGKTSVKISKEDGTIVNEIFPTDGESVSIIGRIVGYSATDAYDEALAGKAMALTKLSIPPLTRWDSEGYFKTLSRFGAYDYKDEERTGKYLTQAGKWLGTNEFDWNASLKDMEGRTDVYLGVAPGDQNFSRLCHGNFSKAIIIDSNPFVTEIFMPIRAALITLARSRAEYLSLLTGVQLDDDELNDLKDSELREIPLRSIEAHIFAKAKGMDKAVVEKFRKDTWERIRGQFPDNLKGPADSFWNKYAPEKFGFLQMVIAMENKDSWLESEKNFKIIQDMTRRGDIIGITGDWTDESKFEEIAKYMREMKLKASVIYNSNISEWLDRVVDPIKTNETRLRNIKSLPRTNDAILLEAKIAVNETIIIPIPAEVSALKDADVEICKAILRIFKNVTSMNEPRIFFIPVKDANLAPYHTIRGDIKYHLEEQGFRGIEIKFYDGTKNDLDRAYSDYITKNAGVEHMALAYIDAGEIDHATLKEHNEKSSNFKWIRENTPNGVPVKELFLHIVFGLPVLDYVKNSTDPDHRQRLLDIIEKLIDNDSKDIGLLKADFNNLFVTGIILKLKALTKIDINAEMHNRQKSLEQMLTAA